MSETNSVVAIYDTGSQAEEAMNKQGKEVMRMDSQRWAVSGGRAGEHRFGGETLILAVLIAALCGGCASTASSGANRQTQAVELSFDLTKCLPLNENMYQCPAIDKPICKPGYNPVGVECVGLTKKGSVFVENFPNWQ